MKVPIVVVDDEEVDRYIVNRVVKQSGIDSKVVEFQAGDEFLEVITDERRRAEEIGVAPPPILVLLDINMPRMTGFEVLESIRNSLGADEDCPDYMVVLMFSSSNHAEDKKEAYSYGFVKDYIVKPLTEADVKNMVERYYRV
ncbi:response regulator [Pelagibius sp.]|uniref:response regulator n=1 Tax=Pelagibius sp. TaxID=1931238 RepID=UPI0026226B6C|nr:response regulator [Pelagibius sp.]